MDYLISDLSVQCKSTENKTEEDCDESVESTPMMAKLRTVILAQMSALKMHSSDGEFLDNQLNALSKEIDSTELDDNKITKLKIEIEKTEQNLKFVTERMELLTVTMEKSYELMKAISDWHKYKFNMNQLYQIANSDFEDQNAAGFCDYLTQINTTEEDENKNLDEMAKENTFVTISSSKILLNDTNQENVDDLLLNEEIINEENNQNKNCDDGGVLSANTIQENFDTVSEKLEENNNESSSTNAESNNNKIVNSEIISSEELLLEESTKDYTAEDIEPENENKNSKENKYFCNDHDQFIIPNTLSPKIISFEDKIDSLKPDVDTNDSVTEHCEEIIPNEKKSESEHKSVLTNDQTDILTDDYAKENMTNEKITEAKSDADVNVNQADVKENTTATDAAGDLNTCHISQRD